MIERIKRDLIVEALARQAAVAIIGPRQVGKTTLALEIADGRESLYLDLESRADRAKLSEPELFLRNYEDQLVILDEIHRVPELFPEIRGIIDRGRRRGKKTGRFLILGSASIELLRQSGESLAGRIEYVDLEPINALEAQSAEISTDTLWIRGGFPDSLLAKSDRDSSRLRRSFIRTYLERDVPQFGPRVPSETLERFWTMLANGQGSLLNASRLAAGLSVSAPTVTSYIDLLADLLLVRRLKPFHKNINKRLVRSPKIYVRDSGLLHALLGIVDYNELSGHPVVGFSWEGFVIENILSIAPEGTKASFYRTSAGAEIDLVLELPGKNGLWAIEIKRSLTAKVDKGFHIACEDIQADRQFVVCPIEESFEISQSIEAIGLVPFLELLLDR
ncbi:MAG TPA: ATP-binding protein [Candidatus Melainabacteria bacterium]|nr:ATP-binding protein [Candidatus Melainabacteria bacterium]HMP50664.1 ATP-binding protein [Candidatus Melainabacteria bacterium]